MKIEKYKPKKHKNPEDCNEDCEKDCDMECMICRKTPWDTPFYYIIEGQLENIQLCESCFNELKESINEKNKERKGK